MANCDVITSVHDVSIPMDLRAFHPTHYYCIPPHRRHVGILLDVAGPTMNTSHHFSIPITCHQQPEHKTVRGTLCNSEDRRKYCSSKVSLLRVLEAHAFAALFGVRFEGIRRRTWGTSLVNADKSSATCNLLFNT